MSPLSPQGGACIHIHGAPANGVYDFQFTLFDAPTGTTSIGVPVVADDTAATAQSTPSSVTTDFAPTATNAQHSATSDSATIATNSQHSVTSDSSTTSQSASTAPWSGITGKPAGFADDIDQDTLPMLSGWARPTR